ncbi:hypothetical protein PUN28_017329 [Cardiocondyla obscurior]|uniref:Uncharacterized protein n=1 Tax=Cardiocondyla obscurior TaxID=286306 RepID=A0AAW2ES74_9HYME
MVFKWIYRKCISAAPCAHIYGCRSMNRALINRDVICPRARVSRGIREER